MSGLMADGSALPSADRAIRTARSIQPAGQPARRRPGSPGPGGISRPRAEGGSASVASSAGSAKATPPERLGTKGRRGSRSPAESPPARGSSIWRRHGGASTGRGISLRMDLSRSQAMPTSGPKTITATAITSMLNSLFAIEEDVKRVFGRSSYDAVCRTDMRVPRRTAPTA